MNRFILFSACFFLVYQAAAQTEKPKKQKVSLRGKISDLRTGEPLPAASVYLADDKIGSSADTSGFFIIENIPPGHHIIEVSYAGYATHVEHIELTTDTRKDFQLSPVVVEHQGVIVTGVSGATSIRKSPVPVTALRKADLLQSAGTNIIDALSHVPGVSQLSTGPAVSKPFIRGLGYNRVVVVNEGIRQEGQQWGDEHGVEIDELSVGRVEILKGPASLIYGSDALAGVIHFITSTPVTAGSVKGNLFTNYQSNNDLVALNGNLAGNKNGFNWNAYGSYKSAADYQNKYDGRVLNSRFNEKNFGGYAGINKSWGYIHFILSRFNQHLGVVEGERDASTGKFLLYPGTTLERIATENDLRSRSFIIPVQWIQHNKFILDNNFAFNKSRVKLILGFQQNIRKEFGNASDPEETSLSFDLKTVNYTVHWQMPELKEWHTTIGMNGMAQYNTNNGVEVLIPEYNSNDIGGFVFAQRIFKKSTFSGGLRFDNRSIHSKQLVQGTTVKFSAFTRSFSNLSGSAGMSLEPSDKLTIKLNIARGFRAPTLAELASNGAHEGTNRYEYGEVNLKSETSLQGDVGIELNNEHFTIGVSSFYNRMNNFIYYRKLLGATGNDSLVNVGGDLIPAFRFTQDHAKLAGIEANFDLHPHPLDWLHIENTLSFVRGNFDRTIDGTDNLPLIPAARLVSELRADFKKPTNYLQELYFRIEADNTFDQNHPFTAYGTETATGSYTLINIGTGGNILNRKKQTVFSLHLALNNLTNRAYQNHLSRLKYAAVNNATNRQGVFNTGRNFSVKLNIPFNLSADK